MKLELELNGRVRVVSIESVGVVGPAGGTFLIHLDGADGNPSVTRKVEMRATDMGVSVIDAEDGRVVDAALTPRQGGEWLVQLPHVSLTATVDARRFPHGPGDGGSGEQRVTAPMPGRIVRVLVRPGDDVEPRQGLVVIEAMKMENELVATRAGTVVEVPVADGMSVEAGRLLVRLE